MSDLLFDGPPVEVEARASNKDVNPSVPRRMNVVINRPDSKMAAKLRDLADKMDKDIDHACRPMSQNATPKRMREYRSRLHDGENMKRTQKALRALADLHEAGTIPRGLSAFNSKAAFAPLVQKSTIGGGYYDVIPDQNYRDKSEYGKMVQDLIDKKENPAARADRERLDRIGKLEADVQFSRLPGFFPTPAPVIKRMLEVARIDPSKHVVLEPSAGKGDIADAIRAAHGIAPLVVEINHTLREILELKGYKVMDAHDFLWFKIDGWDRIIMNPPFEKGADVLHVLHAYELLKPDGLLVAIMSESAFFRQDKKFTAFQQRFDSVGGYSEQLPEDSFSGPKAFRNTGVNCRMVVMRKGTN